MIIIFAAICMRQITVSMTKIFMQWKKSVNLISPYPFWINEKTYVFHKITESEQNRTGLDHPFDYPYDFAGTSHDGLVENAGFCPLTSSLRYTDPVKILQ